jgi:NAD(P)-dependent dehydrogenase (short-subunit alcohol dehydrogenase family)
MRVAVVGASTGLGRCIAIGLAERGAQVAVLARRKELLHEVAEEAGAGTLVVTCDVTDAESCHAAVAEVVAGLGGIDGIVFSSGIGWASRIEDLDAQTWHRLFGTNVVGANNFTAAALPHLLESSGAMAYLTSVSASQTPPWPGLAGYTVTKAAMDKLVDAWRMEHPSVGFTRVVVGECLGGEGLAGSQFMAGWDADVLMQFFPVWQAKGLMSGSVIEVEALIGLIDAVLRAGASASVPSIVAAPRLPALELGNPAREGGTHGAG